MNVKKILSGVGLALMLGTAHTLRAQTGCDDSPEDPTILLALVAAAGALTYAVRAKRSRPKDR